VASAGRHRRASRTEFAVRNRQRLVIRYHPEPFFAKPGHKIVARTGRPFDVAPPAQTESRAELDPEVSLIDEVTPYARVIAANQHRRALVARRVEQDLAQWRDGFDRVSALEHRFIAFQAPVLPCGFIDPVEPTARHAINMRSFDEVGVHRCIGEALGLKVPDAMTVRTTQCLVQHNNVVEHAHGPSWIRL
jgi:hypothetical protein